MDEATLKSRIATLKENLVRLATIKENPFQDPEVYRKSCELDLYLVEYTKLYHNKFKYMQNKSIDN